MATRPNELARAAEETSVGLPDVGSNVVGSITGAAFWSAIALPFLHLPLLLATGLSSEPTTNAFLVLLSLNVLALLLGHSHSRD